MVKRILAVTIIGVMSGMLLAGCGGAAENKPEETPDNAAQSATVHNGSGDNTNESKITEGDTAQATTSKVSNLTAQQCEDEVNKLLGTKAVHPQNEEILAAMCDCATTAKVIDKSGVIFSQLANDERAYLRYRFLEAVTWRNAELYEELAVKLDTSTVGILLEDAKKMFADAYGEEGFTPTEIEQIKDGYMVIPFADGEAVNLVVGRQFFEDEDYILLSGPLFYESNGEGELFFGCADILFAKNSDSRFGATLVYGRCRDVNINISSIEASSELKSSGGKSYSVKNLIDGDPSTVWAEGVSGTGVGETITLHLDKKQPVYGIQLVNGYTAGYEQYINNGTVTSVKVDFGGGVYAECDELEGYGSDSFGPQELAEMNRFRIGLDEPVTTDTIKITITGAAKGKKYDDTCMSEIWVYGPGEAE